MRTSTIELFKEAMKFSAGHFTIFSASKRERLHGHNFTLWCALTGEVDDNGMVGDYRAYKQLLIERCGAWNEIFLLPGQSPHLRIVPAGPDRIDAIFGHGPSAETIPFLASDVLVLPVRNVTLEELSNLILSELIADREALVRDRIRAVQVKVSSGPGQMASSQWSAES